MAPNFCAPSSSGARLTQICNTYKNSDLKNAIQNSR